jgi:VanZ family protein
LYRLKTTLPALLWTLLILATSNDVFSGAHTGSVIATLFAHRLAPETLALLNHIFRKAAHLTGYGILGALWFRALRGERRGWALRWAVLAVVIAAAVASVDEWHQTLVPSRGGALSDVLLDTLGAMLAQIGVRAWGLGLRSPVVTPKP